MSHVSVSGLAYAHPGGDLLFEELSFSIGARQKVGVVGANGVGKSTLLRVLIGELPAEEGAATVGGRVARMAQDVGEGDPERTVRELLLSIAPEALQAPGVRMLEAERALAEGAPPEQAGVALGEAIGDWSELGGYGLEAEWDAACRRIVGGGLDEVGPRPCASLSGGERKGLVLAVLFRGDADVLLLDEPDNFLDIPAKRELERAIRGTEKTVVLISHDRALLSACTTHVLTVEGRGCWMHGASYATYAEARDRRQQLLGDRLERWHEEEKRLRELVRVFKERARYADSWSRKADAMESRWRRWVDAGPPPPPVQDHAPTMRLRGGDSARRVLRLRDVAIDGILPAVTDEVHFGERVGIIGPNGSGKSHLLRLMAGRPLAHDGTVEHGPRVDGGLFTQHNDRDELADGGVLDIALSATNGATEPAMRALARYGLVDAARRPASTLSGGQKARLEILLLELAGHNLLLLDEPTDNLDVESCEALETALDGFEGTVVAVSHDRAFLARLDRFLHVPATGPVRVLTGHEDALAALGG
jgi:ATPase subunit of ABC transporter with duplicated ATPase domains